jgi:hypothetical protein
VVHRQSTRGKIEGRFSRRNLARGENLPGYEEDPAFCPQHHERKQTKNKAMLVLESTQPDLKQNRKPFFTVLCFPFKQWTTTGS